MYWSPLTFWAGSVLPVSSSCQCFSLLGFCGERRSRSVLLNKMVVQQDDVGGSTRVWVHQRAIEASQKQNHHTTGTAKSGSSCLSRLSPTTSATQPASDAESCASQSSAALVRHLAWNWTEATMLESSGSGVFGAS